MSLDAQIELLRGHAKYNGYEVVAELCDEGISGRKYENRPALNKVMAMCENDETDHVLVYSLSRWARSTSDTLYLMNKLRQCEVSFHSYTEKISTDTAFGHFFMTLLASLSELESNLISERVCAVKNYAKNNGKRYVKQMYGFDCSQKGDMKVIPYQMKIVKEVYQARKEGMSINLIAKLLNDDGVPTINGGKWYGSTIHSILKNKIYTKYLDDVDF
jgi:DNA invertase Pin-like site-specific DNA recombinase